MLNLKDVPSPKVLPEYKAALRAIAPTLREKGKLVAVDGRLNAGKTTFARFAAWHFKVSLIETDLFLIPHQGSLTYRLDSIGGVIAGQVDPPCPRSLIVEGAVVLKLLRDLGREPDFVVRVTSPNATPPGDVEEEIVEAELTAYEEAFPSVEHIWFALNLPALHPLSET